MSQAATLDLWVKTLQAYRALHGYDTVVIRAGTTPILDLVVHEQVQPHAEIWYLYDDATSGVDDQVWQAILEIPGYRDRLMVAPLSYIIRGLTGQWQDSDLTDHISVMSVQPDLTLKSRMA